MAGGGASPGAQFSNPIAFMYIFNLIVGTGVLALPSVLIKGGWFLGTIFIVLIAALSYVAATFVVEAMAAANAVLYHRRKPGEFSVPLQRLFSKTQKERLSGEDGDVEVSPLLRDGPQQPFEIVLRTEMGQMADLFFTNTGRLLFYAALIVYLVGDAMIYATFIPKSVIAFVYNGEPAPPNAFDWYLLLFCVTIVPFCFFDLQKTKLLQVATMGIRNAALFTMVVLAMRKAAKEGPHTKEVPDFVITALPNLFGGAVYAFMCHHSLPSMITPIKNKSNVMRIIALAYVCILSIYMLLFYSAAAAFGASVQDPITFNFSQKEYGWIGDALLLFPVFTLSSNYPILTITLRNNLDIFADLTLPAFKKSSPSRLPKALGTGDEYVPEVVDRLTRRRIIFTLCATAPPILLALIAEHTGFPLDNLVGYTGAYAGVAVMFVIPACLVAASRALLAKELPSPHASGRRWSPHPCNVHASPFASLWWIVGLLAWSVMAWVFNTVDKFLESP